MPKSSIRWALFRLALLVLVCMGACKEDWASRIGARALYKTLIDPFPAYPAEQLSNRLGLDPPSVSFVVLGGTYLKSGKLDASEDSSVYDRVLSKILTFGSAPRFVFHVGDIANEAGNEELWELWIRKSHPCAVPKGSEDLADPNRINLLALPGERDVLSQYHEQQFLRKFPFPVRRVYYSFDLDGVHFVALNSETVDQGLLMRWFGWNRYRNRISDEQLNWLKGDLESNKTKPIVVFVHKPMFPPVFSRHEGYCLDQYYFARERLLRLFEKYPVKAVFSGHEPIFYCSEIGGVHYFISAGAGIEMPVPRALGGFHHFLYVGVYGLDRMAVYAVDIERETVEFEVSIRISR